MAAEQVKPNHANMKIHFRHKAFLAAGGPIIDGTAVDGLASALAGLGQKITVIREGQKDSLRESDSKYAMRCLARRRSVTRAGSLRYAIQSGLSGHLAPNQQRYERQ